MTAAVAYAIALRAGLLPSLVGRGLQDVGDFVPPKYVPEVRVIIRGMLERKRTGRTL